MIPEQYKKTVSKDSHWFYRKPPVINHLEVINKYSKLKIRKVLDAGCAEGKNTDIFNQIGYDVIGVDYDNNLLKKAKKNFKNITFKKVDIEENFLKPNSFDLVYCINTLFYTDITKSVKELLRVLKVNGVLFCTFDYSIVDLNKGLEIHRSNLKILQKVISATGEIKYIKKRQRKDFAPFIHIHKYYDVLIIKTAKSEAKEKREVNKGSRARKQMLE